MTRVTPPSRRPLRQDRRRLTVGAVVFAFVAVLVGIASISAASVYAEPSSAEASSTPTSPSPGAPTPTKHSYDDTHSGQQPEGTSPALWILAGAVIALVSIAVILLRARGPARHGLERSP